MGEDQQPLQAEELRSLRAKRESVVTVWLLAVFLALVGALLRPFLAASILLVAFSHLLVFAFWARYVFAACPRCGNRFLSWWSILFRGLPRVQRCCHCGVLAPRSSVADHGP